MTGIGINSLLTKVSKEQFYSWVNPRDICVRCVKTGEVAIAEWKTRNGLLVGMTKIKHDYTLENEYRHEYYLIESILNGNLNIPEVKD